MFRVPLAAIGYYIVAKLTPMAPDGEIGEPAYFVSESIVESKILNHIHGSYIASWILD